ncbi:hypothetical protein SOPP22_04095 [Shewanella sp. OPT22]|nr:hypothetical protein SOPP22_04095 [Shewanella sp. OPT22]
MARMDRQQKLEANLMHSLVRIISVAMILGLIAVAIHKMLAPLQVFHNETFKQESLRLKQVILVLHNQWLIKGKPDVLMAQWHQLSAEARADKLVLKDNHSIIKFTKSGYPMPNSSDNQGCMALWYDLMAADPKHLNLLAQYHEHSRLCRYHQQGDTPNSGRLSSIEYQWKIGKVAYLSLDTE